MPPPLLNTKQPSSTSLGDGDGRTPRSARLREKKFLEELAPALMNHCTDQQVQLGSLMEVASRSYKEILAVKEALEQMERHLSDYVEVSNGKLFGGEKERPDCEEKDKQETCVPQPPPSPKEGTKPVELSDVTAMSGNESMRRQHSPGAHEPQRSHWAPQIRHHASFDYVLGDFLGGAEEQTPVEQVQSKAGSNESLAQILASGTKLNFVYQANQDRPRIYFSVGLFGWTRPFHEVVDAVALAAVTLNSFFTWFQTDVEMDNLYFGTPIERWVDIVDLIFTFVFTIELVLRMWLMGPKIFISGRDKYWNIMDCFFVASSLVEWTVNFADLSYIRAIRIARVMKAFRALRGMRFVRELRLMLASILASFASFVWGAFLITFVMYVFALCLMQSVLITGSKITDELHDLYGSVMTSMITLFMAVSGGRDWADLLQPLEDVSSAFLYFYTGYVSIMVFGIMNVLTALFCENASHIAGVDHGLVIQDEIDRAKDDHEQIKRCFLHADENSDGKLCLAELEGFLDDPGRRALLSLLSIDVSEARGLFDLMDSRNDDEVDLNDYVDAIMRLKGAAKGCDAAMLMYENKRMMIRLASLMCFVCDNFNVIRAKLDADAPVLSLENYLKQDFIQQREAQAKEVIHKGLSAHLGTRSHTLDLEPGTASTVLAKS